MLGELPEDVRAVLENFRCCEFSTIARDGTPLTWPTTPLLLADRGQLLLTTTIGFPVKAANVRRDPRVSMLFSDATGSGLASPPTVLVGGIATVDDDVQTWTDDLAAHWRRITSLQPAGKNFSGSPPARWFMDWYFMRLLIRVTPHTVRWWPRGDTSVTPKQVVADVA